LYQSACIRTVKSGSPCTGVLTHFAPGKRLKNSKGENKKLDAKANVRSAKRRHLGNAATVVTAKINEPLRNKKWKVLFEPHCLQ
jgi:hypothetical protein